MCSVVCLFVSFILTFVLSVLLWFTASDYPFAIFKIVLMHDSLHQVTIFKILYTLRIITLGSTFNYKVPIVVDFVVQEVNEFNTATNYNLPFYKQVNVVKKSLKIPKRWSESVNRRTYNTIRVTAKLSNSEQSYKGKVKTHIYINRQNGQIEKEKRTNKDLQNIAHKTSNANTTQNRSWTQMLQKVKQFLIY